MEQQSGKDTSHEEEMVYNFTCGVIVHESYLNIIYFYSSLVSYFSTEVVSKHIHFLHFTLLVKNDIKSWVSIKKSDEIRTDAPHSTTKG